MQKWAIKQKYKILKLYFFQEKRSWKRWGAKCWVIAAAVGPPIRRKHLLVTYLSASTNTFRKSQLYKLKKIGQNLSKFQTSVSFRNCELFFLLFFSFPISKSNSKMVPVTLQMRVIHLTKQEHEIEIIMQRFLTKPKVKKLVSLVSFCLIRFEQVF